jgi:D-tyrosyl-tRNA(Tyr) deacylase
MRAVAMRVSAAEVRVAGAVVAATGTGLLVLLGVRREDTEEDARYVSRRLAELRVFADADGRMNRSLREVGGELLLVPQVTLYGDVRRGNRPSFHRTAPPELAEALFLFVAEDLAARGLTVRTGRFGATMAVSSVNDGPVTILLDSERSL